jgi:CubicO group peptidase (beta-lactamase class C family)
MKYVKFILLILVSLMKVSAYGQHEEIVNYARSQMDTFHIPALSVAIIDDGKVVLQEALGTSNIEHQIQNSVGTAFQLASVTKLISATALLTLVQSYQLDLNDRIRHFLPELPLQWDDMKVMDLLSHQSGVTDLLLLRQNFRTIDEAVDTAASRNLDFEPGTKTVYAGGDYAIIMKLVEHVSGMSFQEFMDEALFDRLGMKHTVFNNMEQDFIYRTSDTISFATSVYLWDENRHQQRVFSMMFPSWTYAAGGLFSSISDLAKWVVALDKNQILEPAFQTLMWTPSKLRSDEDSPFGVGWIVDNYHGEKVTGHSGGPALADVVRLPDRKITVIVLTNQVNLRPFLAMKILDMYLKTKN